LLYHESTYSAADKVKAHQRGHSTSVEAATIAWKAEVGKLILGHYSSQFLSAEQEEILLNEAQAIFPNTVLGKEQMVLDV
jgi:ribonuclease Z